MNYYVFVFLSATVITIGLLGFGATAFAATSIVTLLIFAFLVRFLLTLINHSSPRPKIKGHGFSPSVKGMS